MKHAFRLSCAAVLFVLFAGAQLTLHAQTTPDPFVTQITSSTRDSFAGDMSGDGRFVVIESTGDISTEKTASRNNADGNREIFLLDYAQRRIFQITNTTSARVDPTKPALDTAKPTDFSNVKVEVSNNKPVISNNGRWIVFSSNAVLTTASRGTFDGDANSAALAADGNQEIYIYFVPATTSVPLSNGGDPTNIDLTAGEFTQITNTPASRVPTPGTATRAPFVAFDNRDASTNDNTSRVAFVSTRDLTGANADGNPEIFVFNRTNASPLTGNLAQLTNTTGQFAFNENPSISGSSTSSVIAFISNANISAGGSTNNSDGNAEVYLGTFDGATAVVTRQVTRTTAPFAGVGVNFFSPGRRISRDGNFVAFESLADLSGDNSNKTTTTVFVYNVSANSFTQVGPRANNSSAFRFPTFTDYTGLTPATVIFSSPLNFTSSGTVPTSASEGLNPGGAYQIFSTPLAAPTTFTRLTNIPAPAVPPGPEIQPLPSNARERIAFSMSGTELGGGNSDFSAETFYLLSRQGTDVSGATASFFTGASNRPVATPSPTPPAVSGLAPGMLAIVRSATALAPSNRNAGIASESTRRPSLPIELNGVSVSVNGAAAGLYFVSPGQINFVVPPGLAANTGTSTYPVVINNNGSVIRATIQLLAAQPDIFTSTQDAGGRAVAFLSGTMIGEPFTVTAADNTVISIFLTGVRNVQKSQVTVRIGTTDITGDRIILVGPTDTPGFDQIDVKLPPSLAGAGDVPVVISVTISGTTFTSRPADTAPRIRIN